MSAVELTLYLHHETDAAYLVSDSGEESEAVWLPKKFVEQGERRHKKDAMYEFSVAEWLAQREGLI
jgi:hypothetical protein